MISYHNLQEPSTLPYSVQCTFTVQNTFARYLVTLYLVEKLALMDLLSSEISDIIQVLNQVIRSTALP